jgi:hypothetical protein
VWLRLYSKQLFSWSTSWVESLFVHDVHWWSCIQIWYGPMNVIGWWFAKCVDDVQSCKMSSRMDDHGLSCLWFGLLQGHDNYILWHAIQGHRSLRHFVEETKSNCWKEKVGCAHFQGVHGRWCISKLESYSHCLWD